MEKNNLKIASKLLDDFSNFIDNRSAGFIIWSDNMLAKVLEWHFEIWKKDHECFGKEKPDEWIYYSQISTTLDSIFQQIQIRVLKERSPFSFFDKLKKHAEKYKKESVLSISYAKSLFDTFYNVFFDNIYNSSERFNIWEHFFPREWKITKSNLQDPENIISTISLQNFLSLAYERISRPDKEKDFPLDDISRNIFPEIDPILWARILIFVFSSYSVDRLRSVIERPWNFGFIGRVKVYDANQEGESITMPEEENNTFDLAYSLFENDFSENKLESYIKSLEQLSYPDNSEEQGKKLRLRYLFTKMLSFLRDIEKH